MAEDDIEDESADITAILDTLPDNDSFLPRYLTVQLLEVLAKSVGKKPDGAPIKNPKFVDSFKAKELFIPLTYSIFWREDVTKALAENPTTVDDTDKYNRAPLTLAIANEDFPLAVELINRGATLLLEDKLVLEIALISMIQRNHEIIRTILNAPSDYDLTWVAEYLEYLNSYVSGEPKTPRLRYHEVLNPPIRHFGQVLDTLAYFNGLPSHYGFLSPSIDILSNHLERYLQELSNNQTLSETFSKIAAAYKKTQELCNYYANLPSNMAAAKTLCGQITTNIKSNSKDVVVLFGGWAGNSVAIAFVNNTLIFSNLGIGGNPDAGTKIFNIKDPNAITEDAINLFICGLGNATAPGEIIDAIGNFVDPTPIFTLKQTFNPIDNCIFVNPRAVIQGILLVLGAYQKDGKATAANLAALANSVADMYNSYVNSLYQFSAADLAKFMRNHELLQNRRIECCALAIDYINQHYKEPEAIGRCIELKNALEFVGLKDFYTSSIDPAAKAAIQTLMIHQQEATAVRVIEQENALAASASRGKK